ncbi:MAG: hypothetical protein OEV40_25215 [Acidimicrobiia bacterium]|nr:hypothetical protein [Acidimicrobiia bacterium]
MKAVGILLLAVIAFFVIKSIVSTIVSLFVTVIVIAAAIAIVSSLVRGPAADGGG